MTTRVEIQVTYNPDDNENAFQYNPNLGVNSADGDIIVANLPGKKNVGADYNLVFTLKGATWPSGRNSWITFRHGGTPSPGLPASPPAPNSKRRSIRIRNGLGQGQPQVVYGFSLNVVSNGKTITSPDPDIVLPPPPPGF